MIGLPHVLATGLLAAGLTGCTVLDMLLGVPPFDPTDPGFSFPPFPTAGVPFSEGHATIELSSTAGAQSITLDRLTGQSSAELDYGTHVVWTDGAGWYLTLYAFPAEVMPGMSYLSMDRIVGPQHWILLDQSRCVATIDAGDTPGPTGTGAAEAVARATTRVSGTAICRGLRWADFFSGSAMSGFPSAIPDQPPFDAEVAFEAH